MRLTIINQFYKPDFSPTATLAASLAEHRAAQGDEVTVIAGKGGYTGGRSGEAVVGPGNVRVLRVWTPGLGKASHLKRVIDYAAFYLFAVLRVLMLPRQDVVISLTTPPLIAWAGLLHKRLHRGTKLVLWNMDCYPDVAERAGVMKTGGWMARLVRWRMRAIVRGLDHLVCLDTAMAELLCRQYAEANAELPVTIIPNWEDAGYFPRAAAPGRFAGLEDLGIDGRAVILYLGNMGYGHRFETVLDAAESLRERPVCFLFVGGGRMWEEVKQEAERRGLRNVIMHGYIPKEQTPSLMASAMCALVTLRDEALGIMSPSKIHSNLAMGLPLIYVGPEGSNVDDAVREHGCGLSVRHGDAAGLVKFVERMVEEGAEYERLREQARRAFEMAYCDLATLPRFDGVIAGNTRPAGALRSTAADFARLGRGEVECGALPEIPESMTKQAGAV
jgi:colanic acid biosynthesis glycosyl transferase WcaI